MKYLFIQNIYLLVGVFPLKQTLCGTQFLGKIEKKLTVFIKKLIL